MKSTNVVAKRNLISQMGRIGMRAFICLSILSLAMPAGAAELKLWHKVKDSEGKIVSPPLQNLSVLTEREKAIKWLVGEDKSFTKFVEAFASEPIKLVEGIHQAVLSKSDATLSTSEQADKLKALKEELVKGFADVKEDAFGKDTDEKSRKEGLMKLISAIIGDGKNEKGFNLDEIKADEFLSKLFSDDMIKALGLLKAAIKPAVTPTPSPKPTVTGELTDEELNATAQQICAAEKARLEAEQRANDKVAQLEKQMRDMEGALDNLAQTGRAQEEDGRRDRKNNANDLITPLLASLRDDNQRGNDITPPAAQVIQPTNTAQTPDTSRDFNAQLPPQEQPQQQPVGPLAGATEPLKAPGEIRSILPTQRGAKEVADAQSAVSKATGVTQKVNNLTSDPYLMMGSMMGMGMGMGMGMMGPVSPVFAFQNLLRLNEAKNEVKSQLQANNANVANIDKRLTALNKLVEKYKDAKLAVSPDDLQKEQQLKAAVDERKADVKTIEQTASLARTDEDRQSLAQTAAIKQNDVKAQERELKAFQDRLGLKLNEISSEVETARNTIEELDGLKLKLETANKELSDKESSLNTMVASNQFSGFGQQQTQTRPNIYPTLGGGNGGPRTNTPRGGVGGALNTGTRRGDLAGTR